MSTQSLLQLLSFARLHLSNDGVRTKIGYPTSDIANRCIHRIRKRLTDIPTYDQCPLLSHKPCHVAAAAPDNYRTALHRNTEPCGSITMNHDRPTSDGCGCPTSCTPVYTNVSI